MPDSPMHLVLLALALWTAVHAALAWLYRRELAALWREPVLRRPVLVVDSDDWGAGPLAQADALRAIAEVLQRYRDADGRAPVIGLALVLAVPDGAAIRTGGGYRRIELDAPLFAPVLAALRDGRARGVFALQLHGLEHFWPDTLMRSTDPALRAWLEQDAPAATEQLPPHLQSRWVDASVLPTRALSDDAVATAVAQEVQAFARIVGDAAKVVVPPTFVWTRATEAAWAANGIECIVTPGWRYPRRDARGVPAGDEGPIVNGDRAGALGCLARCDYFEPVRGRDALHALGVFDRAAAEARPCLLENHRDNFIGEASACRHSLDQLDRLLREALQRHPDLRFASAWDLHRALRERDAQWLMRHWRERWPAFVQRLRHSGRPWKLLRLTGAAMVLSLLCARAGPPAHRTTG